MKTLVIHPQDPTTDFLKAIYDGLGFTVINQVIEEEELAHQISMHDRVIFLGHGSSRGLLGWTGFAFHGDLIYALKNNPLNIFIWCNADIFVARYNLLGLHTGMFISEVQEAELYHVKTNDIKIKFSNDLFAVNVRSMIHHVDGGKLYEFVKEKYSSSSCPVIKFNQERLYYVDI